MNFTPSPPVVIMRDYVCGVCWSDLTEFTENHETWIACSRYPNEHKGRGLILRRSADYVRQRSPEDLIVVREGLLKAGVIKRPDYGSAEDIVKSLGF